MSEIRRSLNSKGQIWISAALYIALGLILITVILSVGTPFINKIKDRNTVLQTKNVLLEMDNLIREVSFEGVGSRRPFFVDIEEGEFLINNLPAKEEIRWTIISKDKLGIESGEEVNTWGPEIEEGNLHIRSKRVGQGYEINLWVSYKGGVVDDIETEVKQLSGGHNLVIEHKEKEDGSDYVLIREA